MFDKINEISLKSGRNKALLLADIVWCGFRYGAGYMDYDLFEMYNLNSKQRNSYLTRGRNNSLVKKYNNQKYYHIFDNKNEFNRLFSDFVDRDWITLFGSSKKDIIRFISRNNEFFVKPINASCGKGIKKINTNDYSSVEELYSEINSTGEDCVLEQKIVQHDDVSQIYSGSINTVRIVTILKNNVPRVVSTSFRIGNGGVVDNFNSGGMVAPVDKTNGIVIDNAIDKNKNLYVTHPISGKEIKGFQFPDWKQAVEMCKKSALRVPQIGYVGWDVCFTQNGPRLVEGNEFPGHDIYQLPKQTKNKTGMWKAYNI